MKTYFRILINRNTLELEHCITSDKPLFDRKEITVFDPDEITGQPSTERLYDEWNGVLESDSLITAGDLLRNKLSPTVESLDSEPSFKPEESAMESKVITKQKNIKPRYAKNANSVFQLDKVLISNKEEADKILIEEFEHEVGRKALLGEDTKTLEDKIKLVKAQKITKSIK